LRYRARRILLAARDRAFLAVTTRLLEKMGFHVIQAESGPQASGILNTESRVNMVILDIELSGEQVPGTLEEILQYSDKRNIHFVILTDYARKPVDGILEPSLIHYLEKPLDAEILHDALQRILFARFGQTRKHIRAEMDSMVSVSYPGFTQRLKVSTISEGGISLFMDNPLPVGTELSVCIEAEEGSDINVDGRVIYTSLSGEIASEMSPAISVEFTHVPDDVSSMLSGIVRKALYS